MSGLKKPHVVAVPFPALGHLIPFFDLAKLLASNGLAVSYVTTPANIALLHEHLPQGVNHHDLHIRLVALPTPAVEGLHGRERYDLLPVESRSLIVEMLEKLQCPFNNWMEEQINQKAEAAPPVCIISDLFIRWAVDTAQKFNIASFLFNTCGAFSMTLMHSISCSILQNALEKDEEGRLVVSCNLSRPLRLSKHEVSPFFLNPDLSNPVQLFCYQRLQEIGKGSGTLVNTFHGIEDSYVEHLKNVTAKPVWAVGPVHQQNLNGGAGNVNSRGKMVDIDEEELLCWLDSKSPRSVVYISFGSHNVLSEEQAHALARALEASEQPFVWGIKLRPKMEPASSDPETDHFRMYLPEGFLERTKERGLIIRGWAPQLVILSHVSVGAFISHCGWNSSLESISLGVPILAWPMSGDQHFNSKLFAELGVGIQLCEHSDGKPEEESFREAVRMVLVGEKGKEMRERAEKLKETAANAVKQKGSSVADLTAFASHMYKLNKRPLMNASTE